MAPRTSHTVAVVGAGLGGTLAAIFLARRGIPVTVFERRPDVRRGVVDHGRSINMTIAERGLYALGRVGLRDRVMSITMPIKGRLVHGDDGRTSFQPYGRTATQIHHSIKRSELNALLLDAAEAEPTLRLHFNKRFVHGDRDSGRYLFEDERTGETEHVAADILVGADGAHSCVRREMQRGELANYEQEYLQEGYRELAIPAGKDGTFQLDPQSLHVWPRDECVLIAIPNRDGSFTCTLTMPFAGRCSFSSLSDPAGAHAFFAREFADVLALAPHIVDEFLRNPSARYLTTATTPWWYKQRMVLLGDACHSVLPFYGQGMNAAFEDCRVLDECIGRHGDNWQEAFAEYQSLRKPHTDALATLSKRNYLELKERVRSPMFLARRRVDLFLDRVCPCIFATLYSQVTHTTVPYADLVARAERRKRWLTLTGVDGLLTAASAAIAAATVCRSWAARGWRSRAAPAARRREPAAAGTWSLSLSASGSGRAESPGGQTARAGGAS